ncbi:MAG: NERD domain-containing protein [Lachnospiraceae bacterium]|nr:NERD domain-containing protein [Lachnospiraceae bacterium]
MNTASILLLTITILGIIAFAYIFNTNYKKTEYYAITHIPFLKVYFDTGRFGEYLTYKGLKSLKGYKRFLFNVYIPKDDGTFTEIDVIMLHESGIYVLESKNYSGWIFGSETQKNWTQTLPSREKNSFLNPIIQNKVHIKWLQSYLNIDSPLPFYSYIVFSERCELKKVTLTSNDHLVIKREDIKQAVSAKAYKSGSLLTQSRIEALFKQLYPLTQVDSSIKASHIQNIQSKYHEPVSAKTKVQSTPVQKETIKVCPRCGKNMVLRTAKKGVNTGQRFYGCSNYPHCRYIEKVN